MVLENDGEIGFEPAGGVFAIYLSGDLGGGTCQIAYRDATGTLVPLVGAENMQPGEQYEVRVGQKSPAAIHLVGSTNPSLMVSITQID